MKTVSNIIIFLLTLIFCSGFNLLGSNSLYAASLSDAENYNVVIVKNQEISSSIENVINTLKDKLISTGFDTKIISFTELAAQKITNINCMIFPESIEYPFIIEEAILNFVKNGGDLVLMGGHAFKNPLLNYQNKWLTRKQIIADLLRNSKSKKILLNFKKLNINDWIRDSNDLNKPSGISLEKRKKNSCLKINICDLTDWDTFKTDLKCWKNHNSIIFSAKGDEKTREVVVEINEQDGSRWACLIELSPQWKSYIVIPSMFKFIADGSPKKRNKKDDMPDIKKMTKISFGLAKEISSIKGNHTIWIDDIGTAKVNIPKILENKNFKISLPVFDEDDIYKFQDVIQISTFKNQKILSTNININGNFDGFSAVGFEYPDISKYVPLLEANDFFERNRGFAAGMLVHYDGEFKGGHWLVFGVTSPEFYTNTVFAPVVSDVLEKMKENKLINKFKSENKKSREKRIKLTTPAPPGFIRFSADKKHFVYPDGRKFFALGCNYVGSYDRKCRFGIQHFDANRLEADFKNASNAGINVFRFWNNDVDINPKNFETIIELARKYNIYLILLPSRLSKPTSEEIKPVLKRIAKQIKNEPIILGYDLINEPHITTVGSIKINKKSNEILKHKTYMRYPGSNNFFSKERVNENIKLRSYPAPGNWVDDTDVKNLYAAQDMADKYINRLCSIDDWTTLYGIEKEIMVTKKYENFFNTLNKTFADWIAFQKNTICEFDTNHYISVGYNSPLGALRANKQLDFISHHIYQFPDSYENLHKSLTTFDRLRKLFPNKPIMLGEFGFSSGVKLQNGNILGDYSASLADIMVYLYAFANDYSGAMIWMLSGQPIANMKHNAKWISESKHFYESKFGLYFHDGTKAGKPKPTAHATKFFRKFVDKHQPGEGTFKLVHAKTPIKTGYVFKNNDALFVGNIEYDKPELSFKSKNPVNVMIMWDDKKIEIMATADVKVKIDSVALGIEKCGEWKIKGKHGGAKTEEKNIEISLLEGEILECINVAVPKP